MTVVENGVTSMRRMTTKVRAKVMKGDDNEGDSAENNGGKEEKSEDDGGN